jgi:hypothetical protein
MQIPGRRIEKDEVVLTASFPRDGDGMFLRAQVVSEGATAAGAVKIYVYTRNSEDEWPDPATASTEIATMTMTMTVNEVTELHVPVSDGIKEELRLKIEGAATGGWSVIRIFPPLFYDTAVT